MTEVCNLAIKSVEQERCKDAISRKKVIDTIYRECSGVNLDIDFAKVLLLQRAIKAIPPVTPQPKNESDLTDAQRRSNGSDSKI